MVLGVGTQMTEPKRNCGCSMRDERTHRPLDRQAENSTNEPIADRPGVREIRVTTLAGDEFGRWNSFSQKDIRRRTLFAKRTHLALCRDLKSQRTNPTSS